MCFTTIRNYITLKPDLETGLKKGSFTTIRNYITLKLIDAVNAGIASFTTIRNYITLKLNPHACTTFKGFTTIRNYITLKRQNRMDFRFSPSGTPITGAAVPDRTALSEDLTEVFVYGKYVLFL